MVEKTEDIVDLSNYNTLDRTTAIKKLVRSLELRLRGYEWSGNGDTFIYTGDVLAGEEVIAKAMTLLQPFCEEANLITTKEFQVFSRQKYDINSAFNATLLTSEDCPAKNYVIIMTAFKATLQNIGDIILGSKNFMQNIFAGNKDDLISSKPIKGAEF